ncbi:MAG: hypothetical protein LLF86_02585 [Nitrospiraceae bacterium]|nr:hypothetical protein [Nitrospiraceae bacterium]
MKILHIIKTDLDDTAKKIIEVHKQGNEVAVVGLNEKSADELLDMIETFDRTIMW